MEASPQVSMPFTEQLVWEHFQRLRTSGGATSAAALLSAFRYAKFVMGIDCMDGILNSKRLKGLSDIMYAGKRKLLQAQTLSVLQVKALHAVLETNMQKFLTELRQVIFWLHCMADAGFPIWPAWSR